MDLFFIILLLFLFLSSAYFSASEAALFSLSSTKIKTYQSNKNPRNRLIAQLVLYPRELLVTIFMLNTLINILIQNTASSLFDSTGGWVLKIGVPLIVTLIFGEILPKYFGIVNNAAFSYAVAPTINFLQNLCAPIRNFIVAITAPISRVMFFFLKKESTISKHELEHVLRTSEQYGVLYPDESELIAGYLSLQDFQVKELIRPREDILFFDINEPLTKLTHLFVDQECTRIPVCNKNIDDVIGIISAHQFFLQSHQISSTQDLIKFLSKPFFIPETTPARLLLRRFDEQQDEMAIAVDEYGSISGLITFEDLVEVVIGEITDRRDQQLLYTKAGENVIIANGKMELTELEEIFGIELFTENNMLTIGGWLTEQLGDIPKTGTEYRTKDFLFKILGAEPNRITSVYVRKISSDLQKNKTNQTTNKADNS